MRSWIASGAAVLVGAVLLGAGTHAQPRSGAVGLWRTPVRGGLVRIETCGGAICGYVAGSPMLAANPAQKDLRNHDPALRERPILGLMMLRLFPAGPGRWSAGWVYDPNNGNTYHGSARLRPDGRLELQGCIVKPLCRIQEWVKAGAP
ncbi:MAG: DUF2147 domain-containing protein [Caulobacteraceae bacterium]